ncbi:hypothetical protein HOLleu_26048 [Holothuria leucospilota]|uniref:Uncharacterized protein n=1 Tax=Holothuria leucospilota TaxID=206669 RepID=A0A9Q1H3Y2_HOLLE|nr:hypothetical protein HOLleu_26048 [Holothuria leucospilota]
MYGLSKRQIERLQNVQKFAVRVISGIDYQQRITLALKSLHWLPVEVRINFKILPLVYKSCCGQTPSIYVIVSLHTTSGSPLVRRPAWLFRL